MNYGIRTEETLSRKLQLCVFERCVLPANSWLVIVYEEE